MSERPTPAYLRGVASGRGDVSGLLTTAVQALSDADLTPERLNRLATTLGSAASQGDAEALLNAETPRLRPVFEGLPPKMRAGLVVVLCAAIQILLAQVVAEFRDNSASPEQVRQIVEDHSLSREQIRWAVEQALHERQRAP